MKATTLALLLAFVAMLSGARATYVPTPDGYWLSPYNAGANTVNASAVTYQLVLTKSATNPNVASGTFVAYILPHPKKDETVNALAAAVIVRRGSNSFDLLLEAPWKSATWVVSKDGRTAKQYPLGKTSGPELFGPKSGFVKVDILDDGKLGHIKTSGL